MKSHGNLLTKVVCWKDLVSAAKRAARGKPLTSERAAFEFDLENELVHLRSKLITEELHRALKAGARIVSVCPHILKADIRKYFPSIDHDILKGLVRRKIKCRPTLELIDRIIDSSNAQEQVLFYFRGG